jgi:hypothetical protein
MIQMSVLKQGGATIDTVNKVKKAIIFIIINC